MALRLFEIHFFCRQTYRRSELNIFPTTTVTALRNLQKAICDEEAVTHAYPYAFEKAAHSPEEGNESKKSQEEEYQHVLARSGEKGFSEINIKKAKLHRSSEA